MSVTGVYIPIGVGLAAMTVADIVNPVAHIGVPCICQIPRERADMGNATQLNHTIQRGIQCIVIL